MFFPDLRNHFQPKFQKIQHVAGINSSSDKPTLSQVEQCCQILQNTVIWKFPSVSTWPGPLKIESPDVARFPHSGQRCFGAIDPCSTWRHIWKGHHEPLTVFMSRRRAGLLGHAQASALFCGCAETVHVAGCSVVRARQRAGRGFPWPWTLPAHEQALCIPCAPQEPHGVVGWLLRSRDVPSVTSVPKGGISYGFPWVSTSSH